MRAATSPMSNCCPQRIGRKSGPLRDGKHNGFPGLKTAAGLLALGDNDRAEHDERWRQAKSAAPQRAEIERLVQTFAIDPSASQWPKPGHRARIAERLAELRSLEVNPETAAVPAAFRRFLAAMSLTPGFLERLLGALLDKARTGEEFWLDPVRKALVEAMPLAIDVAREAQFPRDAGDTRQIEAVSKALQGTGGDLAAGESLLCAISGASAQLLEGPFPQPTLPSLGISFLFSRNKDIPAMGRYGRIGSSSLPIDAGLAARMSGALMAVTAEARRRKTWRLLPAETGDKQDLLIAYVTTDLDAPVVAHLDSDDHDHEVETDMPGEADVEAAGTAMLRFYEGLAGAQPGALMRVLLLRAVDPANRKAIFDHQSCVQAVRGAAGEWTRAMRNAPAWVRWPVFIARKQVMAGPSARMPLSLTALSRKLYIRGGREATTAPGVAASEALALFLGEGDQKGRARRVLHLLLDRHQALLCGLAHANGRREMADFDPKTTARRDGLHSIAWIGALLFFLGRTKEIYMNDMGFKLGQLLSAMDAVHMGYCADVRGGQIPPTLIGNSVFATAGRDPVRALSILCARWKPYDAWAKRKRNTFQQSSGAGESRDQSGEQKKASFNPVARGLSQAGLARQLCTELHETFHSLKVPPTEQFRAELLLGYVAGTKPEPKSETAGAGKASSEGEIQG